MRPIYAFQAASISELKNNPSQLIDAANGQPIAILNHNNTIAYLIPVATFEKILAHLDEQLLLELVQKRLHDGKNPLKVKVNEI